MTLTGVLLLLLMAAACEQVVTTVAPVGRVVVSPRQATMAVGGTLRPTVGVQTTAGQALGQRAVRWSSSSPGVATVSNSGVITGVGAGQATIRAESEGVTGEIVVTVPTFRISVGTFGTGTVRSDVGGIDCGGVCAAELASGTQINLTAVSAADWAFSGWEGACTGTQPQCRLTVTQAATVTARFEPLRRTLTVNRTGDGQGTVRSDVGGVVCGTACMVEYQVGTSVRLTATANTGSAFVGWAGPCSGIGSCALTMSQDRSVTARFDLREYALTLTKAGSGRGRVTSQPAGIDCGSACSEDDGSFKFGTDVTLQAVPDAGSTFAGWSGPCSGTGSCTLRVTAAQSVTARFEPIPRSLTVVVMGNGAVRSSPSGIDCGAACQSEFPSGSTVTLTAFPSFGWGVASWGGACAGRGTSTICSVTMDQARTATVTFQQVETRRLTVSKVGSGIVTSDPQGITLPANGTQVSYDFPINTVVILGAQASSGWRIKTWGGACLGRGTSTGCQVSMTQDRNVTIEFENIQPVPTSVTINAVSTLSLTGGQQYGFSATVLDQLGRVMTVPVEWWNYHQWTPGWAAIGSGGVYSQGTATSGVRGHDLVFASVNTPNGRLYSSPVSVYISDPLTSGGRTIPSDSYLAPCGLSSWGFSAPLAGQAVRLRLDAFAGRRYMIVAASFGATAGDLAIVAKVGSPPSLTDYDWIQDSSTGVQTEILQFTAASRAEVYFAAVPKTDFVGGALRVRVAGETVPDVYCLPPPTLPPPPPPPLPSGGIGGAAIAPTVKPLRLTTGGGDGL